jgi:hypothetical protein
VILWFYDIFIKTNSRSALNRNGRISKSELYDTLQQLSQHDCPIRIFFHKRKYLCMWNKIHTSFYFKNVMSMPPFENFKRSVVQDMHESIVGFIEFNFSDRVCVCLKSNL